jgi:DNA-binding transcriptional MocR family regulator
MAQDRARGEPASAVERVAERLRVVARRGPAGARMPAVRALVDEYGVSPVTVSRALSLLVTEGLVVTRPGDGTYVAEQREEPAPEDHAWQSIILGATAPRSDLLALVSEPPRATISLGSGYLDSTLLPTRELARAMTRVVRRSDAWTRAPIDGVPALREWFARRAGGLDPASVLIVHGGQAAIRIALQATTSPGQAVLVESPTYIGVMAVARASGLRLVPVPSDEDGLRPELLEAAFATSGARVLYCQPSFSNPTGATLTASRRREVVELARKFGAFVIEDDYARDLEFDGRPAETLASKDDGHVIYLRSLTKCVAPSMRVAALCARGPVLARLRSSRVLDDYFVARPMQETAAEFVSSSAYERHLKRLRDSLSDRVRVVDEALRGSWPAARLALVPRGGFSAWVALPGGMDDVDFTARAVRAGVTVSPGSSWYPAEAPAPSLRLSVAGADTDEIRTGIARLGGIRVTP